VLKFNLYQSYLMLKNTHPHTHIHIQQNIYSVANSFNNYECV